jgi:putative SOS response-associated peptidase YedK
MCGRYMFTSPLDAVRQFFGLEAGLNLAPRYNIAPRQSVPIVRIGADASARELTMVEWGLVPSWAKERPTSKPLINARLETIAEKPSFRAAYKRRRCLVPANGFYEWQNVGGRKVPHYIHMKAGALFAFAGIWEVWHGPGGDAALESMAIITTEANDDIGALHHRMPVVVGVEDFSLWLENDEIGGSDPLDRLQAVPHGTFSFHPVSTRLNNVRNEGSDLLDKDQAIESRARQGQLL